MIYLVKLSDKTKVKIDEEDLQKLTDNFDAFVVRLKQAMIRPSFVTCVIPTDEEEFKIEKIMERDGDVMRVVGERKVALLADLMNPEKYQQLASGKPETSS